MASSQWRGRKVKLFVTLMPTNCTFRGKQLENWVACIADGVQSSLASIPLVMTGTTNCYKRFACEVRSKLPELKKEAVGVPGEEG